MRRGRHPLIDIALALASAPFLLGALAALAGQMGRRSLDWDALNHFAPIWLVAAAVAVLLGGLMTGVLRLAVCALGLVGAIAALSTIIPEYRRTTGASAPSGTLKLVQFNSWIGNPHADRVLAFLRTEDPDIAVIEELSPALRTALGAQSHWHVSCGGCEVVILSKARPLSSKRFGTATRIRLPDAHGVFTVIGAHNAWPIEPDQPLQEARLRELIEAEPRGRTLLAGDFNSAPWAFARRRRDAAFDLIRRDRALATWPTGDEGPPIPKPPFAILPIDHVYAGDRWALASVRRGPKGLGSDHYPLIVSLAPIRP